MTTFVSDGGLFVSDPLVIGLLVLLAVVLGFGLTVTFIVWRLVRGVRRWVARRRGVAAAQPRMVRKPGPARDVAKLRRELSDEVSAAELMLSRAKNGRVFVADAQALLEDLKVGAASLDANLASVQNYSDTAQQRRALEALRAQVAKFIETSYLARQTVLQTEIADRERHLTDLSDHVERQAEALKVYRDESHSLNLGDLHEGPARSGGSQPTPAPGPR